MMKLKQWLLKMIKRFIVESIEEDLRSNGKLRLLTRTHELSQSQALRSRPAERMISEGKQ